MKREGECDACTKIYFGMHVPNQDRILGIGMVDDIPFHFIKRIRAIERRLETGKRIGFWKFRSD